MGYLPDLRRNFNGYFGYLDENYVPNEKQTRYGFSENGFGYGWHVFDERFDLSNPDYANEYNRFGWVVEIDPQNPDKKPVKHTAMGCFKHEGAAVRVAGSGKVHVYMGDDQRFDYCYKFVSKKKWKRAVKKGKSPLAEGTLYVPDSMTMALAIGLSCRSTIQPLRANLAARRSCCSILESQQTSWELRQWTVQNGPPLQPMETPSSGP